MIDLCEWFERVDLPVRPWLVIGKGPTFDRIGTVDLEAFNVLALNHVVGRIRADVAHIIDIDVVGDCAEHLSANCRWLLMPRYPHVRSTAGDRPLEGWFDDLPVLRDLDRDGRLVWYNLSGTPQTGDSPVVAAKQFSSEAAFRILGRMGVRSIRSLGIDGGRAYGSAFRELESSTLLANGAPAFDLQFERLDLVGEEFGLEHRPLVEPLRIFLGTDESQIVAHRVLEYSIRKSASIPVEVTAMLNLPHRIAKDPANRPRTTFSFYRFMIPKLCGYRGRALYLDADMLVFGDVAELADMPFGPHKVLCTAPPATPAWKPHEGAYLGSRSVAVMLLDCERLRWDVDEIIADLDGGRYTYQELMSDVCIVPPGEIADTIPPEWNDLEHYEPGRTKLLHYTVVPTQPWRSDENPLGDLWTSWYEEAVAAGAVPPEEVEALIERGLVKPALRAALRTAPSRRAVLTNAALDLATAQQRIARLESKLAAMERSWSWRIGDGIVRALRVPRSLLRSRASLHRPAR
jgi:Glycosyl transferase family 8